MEHNTFFAHQYARLLMAAVLGALVVAILTFTHMTLKSVNDYWGPTTISVSGEGEVLAKPDIGSFSFSVRAEADDAAAAQEASAKDLNTIMEYLKGAGVEEKDLKTQNYWLNPTYSYQESACLSGFCPPAERVIDGYEVNQNVVVKVRDLDVAGDLISGVGERGATNISRLSFTIDDESVYKAEARKAAIADAKARAEALADDLGVRIVKMTAYWENEGVYNGGYDDFGYADVRMMSMEAEESLVPDIPVGENTIRSNVDLTFEVK